MRSAIEAPRAGGLSTLAKLVLAGEIVGVYARARWLLRSHDAPSTLQRLRSPSRGRRATGQPPAGLGRHLAWATVKVLAVLPVDDRCLLQSLVLARLMAVRGLAHEVVFSVASGAGFEAHCWVETGGAALLEPGGDAHIEILRL
ncbi:lasso peptide biosynthesis B2 protein [Solirubrobacter sp. CPCC 204708]|uniref:Lasso peptide biosynthesis B2 protein n=1 Tax=Solirubrobacter deserti TaxID=2282478 RepID=A0ABT4RM63_9ACTN|nr:lasso peptide biosynthesis B2 protein [Solirubrobacter deserti]MBE2317983.1 lasso peptide biosynthesis B2 protein [Solirubrobacter deserti]MDA0139662.1 lasso peptide biosynthesis B2 protein [Solirubrobacter deserti]